MNLYWKKLFGAITPTAKMEAQYKNFTEEYHRYVAVRASKELIEYNQLFELVKSSEFKENKKTLISRKYRDTQEYRDMTKFAKLEKDSELQVYFKVLASADLKEYLDFKNKPEFIQLGKPEEVKKSPLLTKMKNFEKSKDYQTYTRFHDSYILKEYKELKAKVSTEEFKKSNDFWSDAKRWDKTPEAQQERRYFELAKNQDIIFYLKQDPKKFVNFDRYEAAFIDKFDWNTLNNSKWEFGFSYNNPALFGNHSMINEKQANNQGNNVLVSNGHLHIVTKHENKSAIAWHPTKGFVEHDYEYTSDVIHGKKAICVKGGVFLAKMRFNGNKDVSHAFWLTDGNKMPHINICRCNGNEVEVGIYWQSKFETIYTSNKIKGLNFKEFHIFSVEWTDTEIIWYINNYEVLRTANYLPEHAMFPMLSSFISENMKGGEADFEIDYVDVYRIKR